MATGLRGTATLVEVRPGGMIVTSGTGVSATLSRLSLDVLVDDGRPLYRVEHRTVVPLGSVSRLLPGSTFAVRVHPSKPKRLAIVWGGE